MSNFSISGNSEGSVFRGSDGKTYQVINGRDVEVPSSQSWIEGGSREGGVIGTIALPSNSPYQTQQNSSRASETNIIIPLAIGALALFILSRK